MIAAHRIVAKIVRTIAVGTEILERFEAVVRDPSTSGADFADTQSSIVPWLSPLTVGGIQAVQVCLGNLQSVGRPV